MTDPTPRAGRTDDASEREVASSPHWSSGLHESLTFHEASAAELRQELDDLRRRLDAAPVIGQHRAPKGRRGPVVLGAVLVLVLGCGLAAGVARFDPDRPGAGAGASPPQGTGTNSPAVSTRKTVAGAPLPAWPGRNVPIPPGLPAHGAGADVAGTEVTVSLGADRRSADVYERALLSAAPTTLSLRPAGTPDLARSLQWPMPVVADLHAEIDGGAVPVVRTGAGWTVTAPGGTAPRRLALRYRLEGALVHPQPGPAGRYTLVLTPVAPSAGDGAALAVVVRIPDPRVNEIYCPAATNQLCGRQDGLVHLATVPAGSVPLVVALVTFPG